MKKMIFILTLLGFCSTVFASKATDSSKVITSAQNKAVTKSISSDQAIVTVDVENCDTGTPCNVIKTNAETLSKAVNQHMSDKQAMALIQEAILPQIDFNLMTKYVMGSAWRQAEPAQQIEITNLFRQLLVYQYSAALSKFKGAHVTIDSSIVDSERPNRAAVKGTYELPDTRRSNNPPVNIEYDLARIKGNWKIYDVKIENVSIVTTYRSQFNDAVQKGGIKKLIEDLQTRVNNLKK